MRPSLSFPMSQLDRKNPSHTTMTRVWTGVGLALGVAMVGCQPKQDAAPATPTVVTNATTTTPPPPPPGPAPSGATPAEAPKTNAPTPGPANPPKRPDTPFPNAPEHKLPDQAMTVKPDASGWTTMEIPDLGRDADRALTQKRDVMGLASVFYDFNGNKLTGRATIKLRDPKTYSVEYYLPETEQSKNVFKADGSKAYQIESSKWKPVGDAKVDTTADAWARRFSSNQFNALTHGGHGWEEMVDRLRKGEGGFTTVVQQKSSQLEGKSRVSYRILATRPDKTEFEAVFDAEQHLPLTIRYNEPNKSGGVNKMLWTCRWQAGGQHNAKDFALPNPIPSTPEKV